MNEACGNGLLGKEVGGKGLEASMGMPPDLFYWFFGEIHLTSKKCGRHFDGPRDEVMRALRRHLAEDHRDDDKRNKVY